MGSVVEFNDTLKITAEQGFPVSLLDFEQHRQNPIELSQVSGKVFEFRKEGARLFHVAPTRCFLVQEINGKWLYWGKCVIVEQKISGETRETQTTSGKYKIIEIYPPEYQEQATRHESPDGKLFF